MEPPPSSVDAIDLATVPALARGGLLEQAGIRRTRFHDLRHSGASIFDARRRGRKGFRDSPMWAVPEGCY
ncbi:hypothetical protein Ais01nite_44330 [Asanoa ishikariensis]|nr:hypothetical protein Ais01nite_44330 [Asanoa ishikariensis]